MGYRVLVMIAIVLANAFFAAAEVSLVSVRRSRLRPLAEKGQAGAIAALNLLDNPERLLSVTQVGVTLASLGLGWAGEDTLFRLIMMAAGSLITPAMEGIIHGAAFTIAFLLISYAHVVLGEVVPKNLAIDKADRLAVLVAPALLVFVKVAAPFVFVIEHTASAISHALGVRESHEGGHSAEELKFIIRTSWKQGHLETVEESAIQRLLELADYSAREIMVPRNDVVSISVDATLERVLAVMSEHQFSRLPVYENRPENIIGTIHYKDLLPLWRERKAAQDRGRQLRSFKVRRYVRDPLFVPETKPLPQLLADFRSAHTHMAMVIDEFGTVTGLVTLEDVLEQVFGEFNDEHDIRRAAPPMESPSVDVDGTIPIRDLETQYQIDVPAEAGYETLAGFLLFQLGYLPKQGDEVVFANRKYTVLEMERNRIARVRIERLETPASDNGTGGEAGKAIE